jgi:hypothetical protein
MRDRRYSQPLKTSGLVLIKSRQPIDTDGQVRLARVCKRKTSVCFFVKKRLPDEQTINRLRKIAWASVFRFK